MKRLLTLLLIGYLTFISFMPSVQAAPTLQANIVECGSISGDIKGVDVTSDGVVFANVDSDIYRSLDRGSTWNRVLDNPSGLTFLIRVDSQDRIFAAGYNASGLNDIYRSVDHGDTWELVLGAVPQIWRLSEMSNGTLLMNTYSTSGDDLIYKSDNGGESWSVWQNLTDFGNDHIHCVRANPFNDDVWVAFGDQVSGYPNVARWNSGASEWTWVHNTTSQQLVTDILFDEEYAYLLPDAINYKVRQLPHRGLWADHVDVFDIYTDDTTSPSGIAYSMMGAMYADDLMVFGTDRETVMASVDGVRWLKIFQSKYEGSGAWRIDYLSQKADDDGYWYFLSDYDETFYRAHITADDVRQRIHLNYNEYFGTIQTEQMQIPVENDTYISMYIDPEGVRAFTVTAVGLEMGNLLENPSFETGDLTGWTIGGTYESCEVTNTDPYNGTYSLEITKSVDPQTVWIESASSVHASEYGELFFGSIRHKVNYSEFFQEPILRIAIGYYVNEVWTSLSSDYYTACETSWNWWSWYGRTSTDRDVYVRFSVVNWYAYPFTLWLDSAIYERKVENYRISKVDDGDTFVYKANKAASTATSTYYEGSDPSENIQVSIFGYGTLSHTSLSEGEITSRTFSYKYDHTFDLYVEVEGSEQILLRINWEIEEYVKTRRIVVDRGFIALSLASVGMIVVVAVALWNQNLDLALAATVFGAGLLIAIFVVMYIFAAFSTI